MSGVPPKPGMPPGPAAPAIPNFNPSPAGQALYKPGMTSGQYLGALEQNKQSTDAIHLLAHDMPPRKSTWWATQSARKVQDKLVPADLSALNAAESWVKNPTVANQAAAGKAAQAAGLHGPGAWAAQAAAWSPPPAPAGAAATLPAMAAPGGPLTPKAVAGSVQLSSALNAGQKLPPPPDLPKLSAPVIEAPKLPGPPAPPPAPDAAQLAQQSKAHQPFIDLGKDVSAGRNSWS